MNLYNLPTSVWQIFNEAQPEYRMDTDTEMDNRQAMQEFLYKIGAASENIIRDDGTQVTLMHGQFPHQLIIDCSGLGDCYSHKFTVSEN
jgi:hypothetical protein